MQRKMQGLIRFARDFAYGVHAGHGIRHGVSETTGVRWDHAVGDGARGRIEPAGAEPVEWERPATAGGSPI